nr:hypothetical protein [Streptomyces aidingensis]
MHVVPSAASSVPEQPAPARGARTARRRPPRPPRGTPSQRELALLVRRLLAPAVALARWAERTGADPAADPARAGGELGMTPAQVRDHFSRARLAGLVEQDGEGRAVRSGWRLRAWESDDTAVLRGWVALFDGWSLVRPAPEDADPAAVTEVVAALPQLLSVMQLSAGPVTAAGLCDLLAQRVAELRADRSGTARSGADGTDGTAGTDRADGADGADGAERADGAAGTEEAEAGPPQAELTRLLGWALDALADVGALTLHARGDQPARARLTPLGSWVVWTKLEHICVAAQSPAGNIEQSAVAMLRGCVTLTPGPARAEYRAWVAARPTGPAVAELLDAARGEDALIRGLAFQALRVVGAPARAAVQAAAEEPLLRPYALLWLADLDSGGARDATDTPLDVLTREEATWLWVDTASAAHEHGAAGLLLDHLESAVQPTLPALLQEVRACGHPRTVQVLLALASAHPDPAAAKRVRRAAFQLHTGAGESPGAAAARPAAARTDPGKPFARRG